MRALVESIGDGNPIFISREAANKAGYKDTPAPPTFATVPMMATNILNEIIHDLSINYSRLLHGEENYEYLKEIYPGDVLSGKIAVASIHEKTGKSGTMEFIRLAFLYKNQRGEAVLEGSSLFIERK